VSRADDPDMHPLPSCGADAFRRAGDYTLRRGLDFPGPPEGRMATAIIFQLEHELGQRRQTHLPGQSLPRVARQVPSAQGEESGEKARLNGHS